MIFTEHNDRLYHVDRVLAKTDPQTISAGDLVKDIQGRYYTILHNAEEGYFYIEIKGDGWGA
ncbi:MAG: hypothetical protein COA94_07705 [Rickettsiales bacterium]|nr:MAG: hypothetical protein COA94_07705 [Rickettsiales bacterium]